MAALVAAWDALRMPEMGGTVSQCRPSERTAIRNRLRELGAERVALAIAGASGHDWLRRGRARNAAAFVFSVQKCGELAAEGQRAAAAAAADAVRELEREREREARERAWKAEALPRDEVALRLAELRATLSQKVT